MAAALRGNPLTLSTHRLAWTTRISILFAPRFRSSASVTDRVAFATGVPPHLYAFHRYTWNSSPLHSSFPVSMTSRLSRGFHIKTPGNPPGLNNSGQRCHLRITALARLAVAFWLVPSRYRPVERACSLTGFAIRKPSSLRGVAQTFVHCGRFLPSVGSVSQSRVADHPQDGYASLHE